jgi:hypothetical protein
VSAPPLGADTGGPGTGGWLGVGTRSEDRRKGLGLTSWTPSGGNAYLAHGYGESRWRKERRSGKERRVTLTAPDDGRIFSHHARGHDHYWCSQGCYDNDCDSGPCCFPKPIKFVPYVESDDLARAQHPSNRRGLNEHGGLGMHRFPRIWGEL